MSFLIWVSFGTLYLACISAPRVVADGLLFPQHDTRSAHRHRPEILAVPDR
jgi:hypothetical protein